MSFSSITFIWLFLPGVIAGYILLSVIPYKGYVVRNLFLVFMSFLFYIWGDIRAFPFLAGIIFLGWGTGILLDTVDGAVMRKAIYVIATLLQIGVLFYYKYWNFVADNVQNALGMNIMHVSDYFPLGISFIIFQSISYLTDVYRKNIVAQKNLISIVLYFAFFPQLIMGPIVRYHDVEMQLTDRKISIENLLCGIKRFIVGLGKKVIIADCLGQAVDTILAFDSSQWGSVFAWFVLIGYSLQIYFDFSGYTDMALGIGKAFGFYYPENFDLPYISRSVQEFWRRWHMTLSSWFRDYVYIPLGGNRKGVFCTYRNLCIVFFLTGLWHGASWNFIFWGLWHGFFMLLERMWLGEKLKNSKIPLLNCMYTNLVVFVGWMFFRITSLPQAFHLIKLLFIPTSMDTRIATYYFINPYNITIFILGILLCGPLPLLYQKCVLKLGERRKGVVEFMGLTFVYIWSLVQVVSSTYSAFIYQQF